MIAIDWGTTSLRAYRVSAAGQCLERREAALGILNVANAQFGAALESVVSDWLGAGETRILMSGMIGSRQGWQEAPYVECPADAARIAAGVQKLAWRGSGVYIVPGLSCRDAHGTPDVMRGEETQILGVLPQLGHAPGLICLPGTHSKWAEVRDGTIVGFATHMTGEIYALLREHSILKRMMQPAAVDWGSFERGVGQAQRGAGLLHELFGVRARGLFDELSSAHAASYLSGLLIGQELNERQPLPAEVYLLGAAQLVAHYERALRLFGVRAHTLDPDAAYLGHTLLARLIWETA